jgi:hypothetical protein
MEAREELERKIKLKQLVEKLNETMSYAKATPEEGIKAMMLLTITTLIFSETKEDAYTNQKKYIEMFDEFYTKMVEHAFKD